MLIYCNRAKKDIPINGSLLRPMYGYEIVFWVAIGLLVMSGIGNLGVFGKGLSDWHTPWGMKLFIKLMFVAVLVFFSLVRTFIVSRLYLSNLQELSASWLHNMERFYVATALLLAIILTLALGLAHG